MVVAGVGSSDSSELVLVSPTLITSSSSSNLADLRFRPRLAPPPRGVEVAFRFSFGVVVAVVLVTLLMRVAVGSMDAGGALIGAAVGVVLFKGLVGFFAILGAAVMA